MEEKYKQVIQAEIVSSNKSDIVEIIYELIVDKELDKKTIRNKVIKSEFNRYYKTSMSVMDIYNNLSDDFNISLDTVRYIIRS